MKFKINIYKNQNEIEKSYESDSYDLMFGTIEDILNVVHIDSINTNDDTTFIGAVTAIIISSFEQVKPLLKDIFCGLTDEEIKRVKVSEIVSVIIDVVKYALSEIGAMGKNSKKA